MNNNYEQNNYGQDNYQQSMNNQMYNGYQQPMNNQMYNGYQQPMNNYYSQNMYNNGLNSNQVQKKGFNGCLIAALITSIVLIMFILIIFSIIVAVNRNTTPEDIINDGPREKINRTIMIYMVGSDLESRIQLASSDVNDLLSSDIDLENTNVLIMIGGSKNYELSNVDESETSIFKVTEGGLKEVKEIRKLNMGSSNTLTYLLEYGYEFYDSSKYDLIIWDHGMGVEGVAYDELTQDYMDTKELGVALKDSPFNKNNKLDTITFRTCLSNNLTFANVLDDYANYMIASEEVTRGYTNMELLSFISEVESSDDGIEYGKKFIDKYAESITEKLPYDDTHCYSIIDLNKVSDFDSSFGEYLKSLDIKNNYKKISYIRSNMYSYGTDETTGVSNYDTVDIYTFINLTKQYNLSNNNLSNKVLNDFNKVVVYNWTVNNYSKGISFYFPYTASQKQISNNLNFLPTVDNSESVSFVKEFNSMRTSGMASKMDFSANVGNATKSDFNLQLAKDQQENFANAKFIVFKDMKDGYYMPLYMSNSATLDNNTGMLSASLKGKMLKIIDNKDKSESYVHLIEQSIDNDKRMYTTNVILTQVGEEISDFKMINGNMSILFDKNNPNGKITKIVKTDENLPSAELIDMNDYDEITYPNFKYKILDEKGNYTTNWESSGVAYAFYTGTKKEDYTFKVTDLSDTEDYYCVFMIKDLHNNVYYSKLIKMQ